MKRVLIVDWIFRDSVTCASTVMLDRDIIRPHDVFAACTRGYLCCTPTSLHQEYNNTLLLNMLVCGIPRITPLWARSKIGSKLCDKIERLVEFDGEEKIRLSEKWSLFCGRS